jgi:hypothetical protein
MTTLTTAMMTDTNSDTVAGTSPIEKGQEAKEKEKEKRSRTTAFRHDTTAPTSAASMHANPIARRPSLVPARFKKRKEGGRKRGGRKEGQKKERRQEKT